MALTLSVSNSIKFHTVLINSFEVNLNSFIAVTTHFAAVKY